MKELYYGRIPLSVPLQKSPHKYQSHPYPLLFKTKGILLTAKPLNVSVDRMLQEVATLLSVIPMDVVVTNMRQPVELHTAYSDSNFMVANVKPLDVTVVLTRLPILLHTGYSDSNMQPKVKPLDVVITNIYQILPYHHTDITYVSLSIKPLDVLVTKTK